ncbi:MAG: hypothetical protein ACTHVE_01320 [Senegalia sp. (in: firmicutes)]|uniref:hypothetical protein n=1 Tax=Senegalia sp. (in: firmicutes) TaxID=1924098 RepID=UPI003F9AE13C
MKTKKTIILFTIICLLLSPITIAADEIINTDSKEIITVKTESNITSKPIDDFYITGDEINIKYSIKLQNIDVSLVGNNRLISNVKTIKKSNGSNKIQQFQVEFELNYNNKSEYKFYLLYSSHPPDKVYNKIKTEKEEIFIDTSGKDVPLRDYKFNNPRFQPNQIPLFSDSKNRDKNKKYSGDEGFYAYILALDKDDNIIELARSINPIGSDDIDEPNVQKELLNSKINIDFQIPNGLEILDLPEGLEKQNNIVNGKLQTLINYKLDETKQKYIAEPIDFNLKFKANKSGKYEIGNIINASFDGLKNKDGSIEKINLKFPPKEVTVEDAVSDIAAKTPNLFFNNKIYDNEENSIDLSIENVYQFAVEFESDNINSRNTTIDLPGNISTGEYKIFSYTGKDEDGYKGLDPLKVDVEGTTIVPKVDKYNKITKYLLIYDIQSNKIAPNTNNTVTFNKSTNKTNQITKKINFTQWPDID